MFGFRYQLVRTTKRKAYSSALLLLVLCPNLWAQSADLSQSLGASPILPQASQALGDQRPAVNPALGAAGGSTVNVGTNNSTSDGEGTLNDGGLGQVQGSGGSLSVEQIYTVLQERPDVLVELKSVMADTAQQQGASISADAITDEMFYDKVSSSPELRRSVTIFLRARGYVSDADLADAGVDSTGNSLPAFLQSDRTLASSSPVAGSALSDFPSGTSIPNTGRHFGNSGTITTPGGARSNVADPSNKVTNDTTSEPQVLHRPTPYNLLSLHDLYSQLPELGGSLKRFGSDVFLRRSENSSSQIASNSRGVSLDIPAGPSYVVGPGDSLSIDLWGGISQSFVRVIDREGRLALPESGALQVAGLTLERVQGVIDEALKGQYRNLQVAVTVARLRSIRIYVVGDVQRPGAYEISSLSTSLNALYAAGGPTRVGSLRILRHYRGKQFIGEVDLYDFLLHGVEAEDRLQAGDTVLVPPAGPQVAVYGAVKRPAIYELKGDATLETVLEDAGGATVAAALDRIEIDRIDANQRRETVTLDLPAADNPENAKIAIKSFTMHDGDRIRVSPILPYSQRVVYLQGHVVRPGRIAYHDNLQLSDVLRNYRDLLPEPADKGEIVRLTPPDLHPETIEFNLPDILIGNNNLTLQPFDTVRIYGRYEADAPKVTVGGEVLRPGVYALSNGMTAAQLVRMAGGLKRDALLDSADLTSYQVREGSEVVSERSSIHIGDALNNGSHRSDVTLKPGDVLTIHQIAGWNDIGSSITIEGEVAHPGSYGIQQGERLSSILRRAGGFRESSYGEGAVLLRDEVRQLEEKSRLELIKQIETSSTAARISPSLGSNDQSTVLQLIAQQQDQVLARLKSQPAVGRLVIHISNDISSWENTPADIQLRAGDVLRIPKRPGFVLVSGQVYNTSAITFSPGKTAGWYLQRAGGVTEIANKGEIFVIRANGSVVGRGSSTWLNHDVLATKLDPGDVVVVPQKILGASLFWRNLLTIAQFSSSIAITAAVAGLL